MTAHSWRPPLAVAGLPSSPRAAYGSEMIRIIVTVAAIITAAWVGNNWIQVTRYRVMCDAAAPTAPASDPASAEARAAATARESWAEASDQRLKSRLRARSSGLRILKYETSSASASASACDDCSMTQAARSARQPLCRPPSLEKSVRNPLESGILCHMQPMLLKRRARSQRLSEWL